MNNADLNGKNIVNNVGNFNDISIIDNDSKK